MRYLIAVLLLSGCLDGAADVTSGGTDGAIQTHIPVGDAGCFLVIGEIPGIVHCPTVGP